MARSVRDILAVRDIRRSWVGGELVPFYDDLTPTAPEDATCGVNADGGRLLTFKANESVALDSIGSETRPEQPDRGILCDGSSTAEFHSAISYALWWYAWRVNDEDYIQWYDSENTYLMDKNGVKTTTSGGGALNITGLDLQVGVNYDHRFGDLTGKTVEEIAAYMDVNACKFHIDAMEQDSNFLFHRYLLNSTNAYIGIDSGTASKEHLTMANVTPKEYAFPSHLKNWQNKENWYYDYTLDMYLPTDLANPTQTAYVAHELEGAPIARQNATILSGDISDMATISIDFGDADVVEFLSTNDKIIIGTNGNIMLQN